MAKNAKITLLVLAILLAAVVMMHLHGPMIAVFMLGGSLVFSVVVNLIRDRVKETEPVED